MARREKLCFDWLQEGKIWDLSKNLEQMKEWKYGRVWRWDGLSVVTIKPSREDKLIKDWKVSLMSTI